MRIHKTSGDGGDQWSGYKRVGRLQFRINVYRHVYPRSSDRWAVFPSVTYDRKRK